MRIGYYVQGAADEAFVRGLRKRWCPNVELAEGRFRGESKESFRREISKALIGLRDGKCCDVLIVLTDADKNPWKEVKRREWKTVPAECRHITAFGVADRNIESWLSIDRKDLARELGCKPDEIPPGDPSGFVKGRFGLGERDVRREEAKKRVEDFVARVPMKSWIENSDSFKDFYERVRDLSIQNKCALPNDMERL